MFSIKNSFDNKYKINKITNTLPFIGEFEPFEDYEYLFIYAFSEKADVLTVQFSNQKDDQSFEIEETYNIIPNIEQKISIVKKLKYYKIKINTATFNSTDKRIYNTYLFKSEYIPAEDVIAELEKIHNDVSGLDVTLTNIYNDISGLDLSGINIQKSYR